MRWPARPAAAAGARTRTARRCIPLLAGLLPASCPPPARPLPTLATMQVHARGKTIGKDVDFEKIARRTPGFTGALGRGRGPHLARGRGRTSRIDWLQL